MSVSAPRFSRPQFRALPTRAAFWVVLLVGFCGSLRAADPAFITDEVSQDEILDARLASFQPPVPAPATPRPSRSLLAQNQPRTTATTASQSGRNRNFSLSSVPNMIGDAPLVQTITFPQRVATIVVPGPGGMVGRVKIAENTSPIPQDRVFFSYSYFDNVPLGNNGVGVNRYTPGFEKTFFNGLTSIDVRTPFASTISNDVFANGLNQTNDVVFGDMLTTFKAILLGGPKAILTGGLALALPTSPDTRVRGANGATTAVFSDTGVNYMPFVGYLWKPTDRFFVQGFTQFDLDPYGAQVSIDNGNGNLNSVGRVYNSDLVFMDLSFGYWMVKNVSRRGTITGLAPVVEFHYNKAVDHPSSTVPNVGGAVAYTNQNLDNLNITVGLNCALPARTMLTAAYIAPVTGQRLDKQMDGEFRFMLNRYFGSSGPLPR
jgi:hypothetical protein